MDLIDVIHARRTVRAFKQDAISTETLTELVEAARVGPSAANLQPLEYVVVSEPGPRAQLFACLKWAAYTAPVGTPGPGEEPTAYVVVLTRGEYASAVGTAYDVGAAVQTILLLAVARGLGGAWIKSVNYPAVKKLLGVPEGLEVDSVVALGVPAEQPQRVDLAPADQGREVIRYWRDEAGQHFVPKRSLEAVLRWQRY
jgi:nitroreductase